MLKIGQNWGKIANNLPNAQQRSAPLIAKQMARQLVTRFGVSLREQKIGFDWN